MLHPPDSAHLNSPHCRFASCDCAVKQLLGQIQLEDEKVMLAAIWRTDLEVRRRLQAGVLTTLGRTRAAATTSDM
jgi:hypothetical protein